MATHQNQIINRQKKGGLGMVAFFKQAPEEPASTKSNKPPRTWLLSRKKKPSSSAMPETLHQRRFDPEKRVISVVPDEGGGRGRGRGRGVVSDDVEMVVAARRSVSQVETNLASAVAFLQVKVVATDMPGSMQVHAFRCARASYDSLEKFSSKHMAFNMKKEFDEVYGPAWHCIVGSNFGSFVTHATGCFIYFSVEKLYVLLFRTKVQL
ncbi:hypothetical protein SAY87_002035 [Trapa incisa]|uniref:Dynein light chain n=1 Tax=Trapa incisa TaxID=236973 RepID=A0AAN7PU48_9MYRT|nr:hypothetical protein SAY87_002035 [Trapa incisa]